MEITELKMNKSEMALPFDMLRPFKFDADNLPEENYYSEVFVPIHFKVGELIKVLKVENKTPFKNGIPE